MNKKNKNNELSIYEKEQKIKQQLDGTSQDDFDERINRKTISLLPMAQYKFDTDISLYERLNGFEEQIFWDTDFNKEKFKNKEQIKSGRVIYEDRTHKTEIIFEGWYEITGGYSYTSKTDKIKDVLEEYLITQYKEIQNPTLFITLKTLAKEIQTPASDLRKNIVTILESLEALKLSYTTKGKFKDKKFFQEQEFASLRIISSSKYIPEDDLIQVNFDNEYAYKLSLNNFYQLPKKYRKISENSFQYAYPLAKYIFQLYRQKNNKITFRSLYERIKKIPRYEDLKKTHSSLTDRIYTPLTRHFEVLSKQGDFTINFENQDFMLLNSNKNIDFEKMLDTNIIIKWQNNIQYGKLDSKEKKIQQKLLKQRANQIEKAKGKKALS